MNLWTIPSVAPKQYLMLGSDSSFQDITQNLKIRKPLHARDWWLLHHWPEMIVSMENYPSWFGTLQKSHLIVPISTVQISRTSSLKWDLSPVFLMECKVSEWFFPMNTDASTVEDINILQIIERLSMSCNESSGERFSIFRHRSFTLFRKERGF